MTTHTYYAYKRDGIIHPATICDTVKAATEAARVYCVNTVQDRPDPNAPWAAGAWEHLVRTGRLVLVELCCREREVKP